MPSGKYKRKTSLKTYINRKIYILEEHFYLKLTFEEKDHMRHLKTEGEVDAYAHDLISRKL